jgi:hypothetical protein
MADIFDDSNFGAEAEMSSLTVDWGMVGDFVAGTFLKARHNVETQFGMNSIYEILAERGSFHKLTKKVAAATPTIINKGEVWAVWGRNEIFNGQMNSLRPGQVIKISFDGTTDTKMGESKTVKIFAPKNNEGKAIMNEAWLADQSFIQ